MRGGGSRGGQNQGGKRQATTPVGGIYKDSRRNIQGEEDFDEEDQWTQVIRKKQKNPTTQSGSGFGPDMPNQPDPTEHQNEPSNSRPSFASVVERGQSMQSRRDSMASAAGVREKKP